MASPQKPAKPKVPSGTLILIRSFIIPLVVLVFYFGTLRHLNSNTREAFIKAIEQNPKRTAAEKAERAEIISKFDFVKLVVKPAPPEYAQLRASLEEGGIAAEIRHVYWGLLGSYALLGILIVALAAIVVLNRLARRSQGDLARYTRIAWKVASVAALMQVILFTPLVTYGTFEFTVLAANRYYPQLLLLLAGGGIVTIVAGAKILLRKVPLKAVEPMSREVSSTDSPELWAAVRDAAARLQTSPPDRIIVGMQLNFFVTELAVQHDYGEVEGKTLFLSYPLMRQLSEEEIIAIIGHELGHFMGEDTRLTREFYPLWRKAGETLHQFGANPMIAWTSFQFLNFFAWTFSKTENSFSREREILADQKAAALTSPAIAARALVKFHAMTEALHRGITAVVQTDDPAAATFETALSHKLPNDPEFWTSLFEERLPHPLDSHPPLNVRLTALGQLLTKEQAQAITQEESPNAFARWFQNRESLFEGLLQKTESVVKVLREKAQISNADYSTEAGRKLLNHHFPERKWRRRPARPWFATSACVLLMVGVGITIFFVQEVMPWGLTAVFILFIFGCAYVGRANWVRHSNGELTLNAVGIHYSGWVRPLAFSDVKSISAQTYNATTTLYFHLKEKSEPFWKMALPMHSKSVGLNIMPFGRRTLDPENAMELANTIYHYFTRQAPAHSEPEPAL